MSITQTIRLTLPRPHPAQIQVLGEARRFNVVDCGRRWGKTTLGINLAADAMLKQRGAAGWFAASNKLQSAAWRDVVRVLQPVTRQISQQEHRLELITGGTLEMWSLEATGAGRGRKYHRVIVDEADYARDLETDWNEAIRPTLADYQGDAWFFSTPNGRRYFWTLWMRGQDIEYPDWAAWKLPTVTNPYIAPSEVEAARIELPERAFLQEYEAEFIEDGAGVFRRVTEAATATPQDAPLPGHEYVLGVDWAKHADFTVLVVLDLTTRAMAAIDRFNQIDYTLQLSRLTALCERFRPRVVIAERNSMGEPLIEQCYRQGLPMLPFTTTNATKAEAIDGLALAFERQELSILNDRALVTELLAYESERLPSGLLRYSAPPGLHDDCVMALALAWSGATASRPLAGL